MHKNAIKKVRGVNFYGIWVKNTVIFPRFWTFSLVIFVIFWLNTRDFQEKSFGNTAGNSKVKTKSSKKKLKLTLHKIH